MAVKISKVELQYWNQPNNRRIKVYFVGGKYYDYAYIYPCHESYEVCRATHEEAVACGPIARQFNDWLHGYCPNSLTLDQLYEISKELSKFE